MLKERDKAGTSSFARAVSSDSPFHQPSEEVGDLERSLKVLSNNLEEVKRERDNLLGKIAAIKMSQDANVGVATEALERALRNEITDLNSALALSKEGREVLKKDVTSKWLTRIEASLQREKSSTAELSQLVKQYKGDLRTCVKAWKEMVERAMEASRSVIANPAAGPSSVKVPVGLSVGTEDLARLVRRTTPIGCRAGDSKVSSEELLRVMAEAIWSRPANFRSSWATGAVILNAIARGELGEINREIEKLVEAGEGGKRGLSSSFLQA